MADTKDPTAALHKAAEKKARHGAVRAVLFLVLALVAAVGSAVLLTRYMEARTAAARVPTVKVVVAGVHLPAGSEIRAENLRAVDWPAASRPEGTFEDPAQLEGKVVSASVAKGEAILPSRLAGSDAGAGLAALLPPGMRAVAVRVDDVVGVAGFLHPGDSVDVIATLRGDGGQNQTSSKVILQKIKVLAVGKELDHHGKASEKAVQATVATLMVDAEQSERLALAAAQGKILLTLRGGGDLEVVETKGVSPTMLLAGSKPVPPVARKGVARGRAEPSQAPKGEVVEILRGDLFERRDFARPEVAKEERR